MKRILFAVFMMFGCCLSAADEKITVTGSGSSVRSAVVNALNAALEQKYGVTLSSEEVSSMLSEEKLRFTDGVESVNVASNDSLKAQIQVRSKGRIDGYREVSRSYDPSSRRHTVTLEVFFPGRYVVGNDPDDRRRMSVGKFYTSNAYFSVYGVQGDGHQWVRLFTDALNIHLTQTRKFTMLDRKFTAEIDRELDLLTRENASAADISRLGQKLGTDYLIVGTVSFSNVADPGVNPYTGQALPLPSANFARVHYRVLLAATGQLKWADTVTLDAVYFQESLLNGSMAESAEAAAEEVSDGIMSSILPFEIVGFSPDGTLVIGEGGKSMSAGDFLSAYALGDEVKDTRTGEVIDTIEARVGLVQVVRVTEKLSYAVIVKGEKSNMPIGTRLRRDDFSRRAAFEALRAEPQSPQVPVTTVIGTEAGGVVVPF